MKLKTFTDGIPLIETDEIEARRIYTSEKTNAVQIHLKPGAVVDKHITAEDVFFLALSGSAEICIAGESSIIREGELAECPGGIEKGLINNSENLFKVLVIKMDNL